MKFSLKPYSALLCMALLGALSAAPARANMAANTQIINQAQLSYSDGVSTKTASASVTVTVGLVASAPNIIPGPPQSTSYAGAATILTDSYTITAGANGPDTYNLSAAVTGSTNTSGATATSTAASVALGASVTTVGSTTTTIVVPADGNLPGEMSGVNGIQVGDTVVINGETRTVIAITDNASGTSTITLNSALGAAPGVGVLVAEQKVVTTTVTAGTITVTGTDVTVSDSLTATSVSSAGATATSGSILNNYTSGVATLNKYVRNVSVASGSGVPYIYTGINYYPNGVTAKPGETLEYILVATNSGSGAVNASVVNDVLPTSYVTLRPNAYGIGKEITYVSDTNVATTLSAAADGDNAKYDAATKTLTVNIGSGATNAAGGSIPGGNKSVLVLYQVTLNP
ncbi:MAG: hypothetical protein JJE30_16530 [Desulfuromonadales bacterium]|nr:hypothetical protein [Desulfuromonadales bacterium]